MPSVGTYSRSDRLLNCRIGGSNRWEFGLLEKSDVSAGKIRYGYKDNTRLVDGDDTVFIRLVDYDLVDGQLAYAAGGPPSKPLEWMVSNPLSPNPCTVAMQAQDGFGRYWNLIVTGLINPEDNEASEKKAEQLALDSSSGLAHLDWELIATPFQCF